MVVAGAERAPAAPGQGVADDQGVGCRLQLTVPSGETRGRISSMASAACWCSRVKACHLVGVPGGVGLCAVIAAAASSSQPKTTAAVRRHGGPIRRRSPRRPPGPPPSSSSGPGRRVRRADRSSRPAASFAPLPLLRLPAVGATPGRPPTAATAARRTGGLSPGCSARRPARPGRPSHRRRIACTSMATRQPSGRRATSDRARGRRAGSGCRRRDERGPPSNRPAPASRRCRWAGMRSSRGSSRSLPPGSVLRIGRSSSGAGCDGR